MRDLSPAQAMERRRIENIRTKNRLDIGDRDPVKRDRKVADTEAGNKVPRQTWALEADETIGPRSNGTLRTKRPSARPSIPEEGQSPPWESERRPEYTCQGGYAKPDTAFKFLGTGLNSLSLLLIYSDSSPPIPL